MRRLLLLLVVVAVAATSCQKEVVYSDTHKQNFGVEITNSNTRSYQEALAIAEDALTLLEGKETRSTTKRVIKRSEGQTVKRPVTRGSETEEEPIMYVFNNEDNQGFTIVAADKTREPLIAVTEKGNYTYGEPTEVEAFDAYIGGIVERLVIPIIPPGDTPLDPIVGCLIDTVRYNCTFIGPLLKTKWGQNGIYARETMLGRVGCGPVAIAQIMGYHRYPHNLELSYKNPSTTITLNWNNITKHRIGRGYQQGFLATNYVCDCGCDYTTIGQLLREVGQRAGIDYSYDPEYGGVNVNIDDSDVIGAMVQLGYNITKFSPIFDVQTFMPDMLADLNEKRPVILLGQNREGSEGHIWVADGYQYIDYEMDYYVINPNYDPVHDHVSLMYVYDHTVIDQNELIHFNWGWDGMCDGWFNLSTYDTSDAYIYDDNDVNNDIETNFGYEIKLFYDIYPNNFPIL